MAGFNPQNLLEQASRAGRSLADFAERKAEQISEAIQTSANIIGVNCNSLLGLSSSNIYVSIP